MVPSPRGRLLHAEHRSTPQDRAHNTALPKAATHSITRARNFVRRGTPEKAAVLGVIGL
jgi:hypothetical protein